MTTQGSREQMMIELMERNLEQRIREHRASLAQELAGLRAMAAEMEAALSRAPSVPMGVASRIRAAGLDVERASIELKSELEALECARAARRAIEAVQPGTER